LVDFTSRDVRLWGHVAKSCIRLFIWWSAEHEMESRDSSRDASRGSSFRVSDSIILSAGHCKINKETGNEGHKFTLRRETYAPAFLPGILDLPEATTIIALSDDKPDVDPLSDTIWTKQGAFCHHDFTFFTVDAALRDDNFFLIPDSVPLKTKDAVVLVAYHAAPTNDWVKEAYGLESAEATGTYLNDILTRVISNFDNLSVSPGQVLGTNGRMGAFSYSSLRSSSGGAIIRIPKTETDEDPKRTARKFCGILEILHEHSTMAAFW